MLEFTTQEYPQHELLKQYQSDALPENEVSEFIKSLVDEYYTNSLMNHHSVKDSAKMNILIKDLGNSLLDKNTLRRDSIIFENYVHQKQLSHFNSHLQFVRMEVYHMMKMNFDNMYPGFLGMLINKNIYHPSEIYPVLGILSDSEVLWKKEYDETGSYCGYTIKSDGFYTGSDFFNSKLFNQYTQSDITCFPLKQKQSPLENDNFLILNDKTIWTPLADKSTLDYIDGVILIKQSAANIPIEELEY